MAWLNAPLALERGADAKTIRTVVRSKRHRVEFHSDRLALAGLKQLGFVVLLQFFNRLVKLDAGSADVELNAFFAGHIAGIGDCDAGGNLVIFVIKSSFAELRAAVLERGITEAVPEGEAYRHVKRVVIAIAVVDILIVIDVGGRSEDALLRIVPGPVPGVGPGSFLRDGVGQFARWVYFNEIIPNRRNGFCKPLFQSGRY